MGLIEEFERRVRAMVGQRTVDQARKKEIAREEEEARTKAVQEEIRMRKLAVQAMQDSVVPTLANRLHQALERLERNDPEYTPLPAIGPSSAAGEIVLSRGPYQRSRDGQHREYEYRVILFRGHPDGSVMVGQTRLSAADARDPIIVENVINAAYMSPEKRTGSVPEGMFSVSEDHPQQ